MFDTEMSRDTLPDLGGNPGHVGTIKEGEHAESLGGRAILTPGEKMQGWSCWGGVCTGYEAKGEPHPPDRPPGHPPSHPLGPTSHHTFHRVSLLHPALLRQSEASTLLLHTKMVREGMSKGRAASACPLVECQTSALQCANRADIRRDFACRMIC